MAGPRGRLAPTHLRISISLLPVTYRTVGHNLLYNDAIIHDCESVFQRRQRLRVAIIDFEERHIFAKALQKQCSSDHSTSTALTCRLWLVLLPVCSS